MSPASAATGADIRTSAAARTALAVMALVYAVALYAAAPAWPDDWDGIGFLLSMRTFDLAAFQPHPPGYFVYVLLLRLAALAVGPTMQAVAIVAALSGAVTVFAAGRALVAYAGKSATSSVLLLAATPLVFHACSGVGSEAPALALYALGWWALAAGERTARPRLTAAALGAAVAFGLGVRLSWAPLYIPLLFLLPRGRRRVAWAALALGILLWLPPFARAVGPERLLALVTAQASGHFTRWGGSELTDPGPARFLYFARDLVVDGLGAGKEPLGIATSLVVAAVAFVGIGEWREAGFPNARPVALVLAPYALWVLVGQNVAAQPRHLLPLVAVLSLALAECTRRVSRTHILGVALGILLASRAAIDAEDRRTTPPAGVQMINAVDASAKAAASASPAQVPDVLFGGASSRFAEITERGPGAPRVLPAATLGDVELSAGRLDHLPPTLLVTSEITGSKPPAGAKPFGTYCRPERLDRRAPCLTVVRIPSR